MSGRVSLGSSRKTGSAATKDETYFATAAQGTLADTAVQPARAISAGTGLAGGGSLASDMTLSLSAESISTLAKAETNLPVSTFATVADLLAEAVSIGATTGDVVKAGLYLYEMAASGATDHHVTTAAGDKLYILPVAGLYPMEAFGVSETNTGPENRVILRAALDTGLAISGGPGDFPLSNLVFKSEDHLWGVGRECHFVCNQFNNIVMATGPLSGTSFNTGITVAYNLNTVSRGDATVTLSGAGDGADFAVGELVFIYCDLGYTSGAGDFRPGFQWMTKITDVTGDVLTLQDRIYRDAPAGAQMKISRGADIVNPELDTKSIPYYGLTEALKVGNFSVSVADGSDSWHRFGGTYNSEIGPIFVRKSKCGMSGNAFANSKRYIPEAVFTEFLVEETIGSHGSQLDFGVWRTNPDVTNDGRALVSLAEGAHDNEIYLGSGIDSRNEKREAIIAISDGGAGTRVSAGVISVQSVGAVVKAVHRDAPAMSPDNCVITSGLFKANLADYAVQSVPVVAGGSTPFEIGENVTIDVGTTATAQVSCSGSGWKIGGIIDAEGSVVIDSAAKGDLRAKFVNKPTSVGLSGAVNKAALQIPTDLSFMAGIQAVASVISSTTYTSRYSRTIPAGTVIEDDALEFEGYGVLSGTADDKRIRVRLNVTNTLDLVFPAAAVGNFEFRGAVVFVTTSSIRVYISGSYEGTKVPTVRSSVVIVSESGNITFDVGGLVDNVADGIAPEYVRVMPRREVK